jgi:hypothetical protein
MLTKRALACDINARMAALQRQWEASGHTDLHALRGALVFCRTMLPPWLAKGLLGVLDKQFPQMRWPYHEIRWLAAREGMLENNLCSQEAYEYAVARLADTPARCGWGMMMKSYQKIERSLSTSPRRPKTRRRKK